MTPIINPWAYYQINEPDKIPNLNPQNDDEFRGCLSAIISFSIAVILYILLNVVILKIKENDVINDTIFFLLILVNIFIFAAMTILFMTIGFKITNRINKKHNTKKI